MTREQVIINYIDFICENVTFHFTDGKYKDYMWGEKLYFWLGDTLHTGGIISEVETMFGNVIHKSISDRVLLNINNDQGTSIK